MTVSLKDIANDLNVSVSLVSKVLNNRLGTTYANPKTASAIRARANELNYQKNRSAEALSTGRQDVFGVFIHPLGAKGSGIVEELLRGIASALEETGRRMWLVFFLTDEEFVRSAKKVHRGIVDGLILGGCPHHELTGELLKLQDNDIPIVTIHDQQVHEKLINVGADQSSLAHMATQHLLSQGCTRIAHLDTQAQRTQGFFDALADAGVAADRELIFPSHSDFEYKAGERAAKYWIDRGLVFDGVVTQSDQQALGVLHTLIKAGVRVPQDVKIAGIDNSDICESSIVALTSVSEQYGLRGRKAVELLLAMTQGDEKASIDVPARLIPRDSG